MDAEQWDALVSCIASMGENESPQPAYRNHCWTRTDGQAIIFEAMFDDEDLSTENLKNELSTIMLVDSSTILTSETTSPENLETVFSVDAGLMRTIKMSYAGCREWEESRLNAVDYVSSNQEIRQAITVTNLNDSGVGSLRAAIALEGFRDIHFSVSGNIRLLTPLVIEKPDIAILGETAPNGGICIADSYLRVSASNVLINHIRIRPGADLGVSNTDAVQILLQDDFINNIKFRHCSLSWAVDENVDVSTGATNVVFEDCIISEGLNNSIHIKGAHSCGALVHTTQVAFIRCLFAHNNQRNPLVQCGDHEEVNCVHLCTGGKNGEFYDSSATVDNPTRVNLLSNYYIYPIWPRNESRVFVFTYWDIPRIQIYPSGNYIAQWPEVTQRQIVSLYDAQVDAGFTIDQFLVDAPHPRLTSDAILSAADAYAYVLANAGATLPERDTVDTRIINDVINGTGGLIDDPADVGGWPEL